MGREEVVIVCGGRDVDKVLALYLHSSSMSDLCDNPTVKINKQTKVYAPPCFLFLSCFRQGTCPSVSSFLNGSNTL